MQGISENPLNFFLQKLYNFITTRMGICLWSGILQLVIISSLACFQNAQFHYPSTAQVSTSWSIKNLSIPLPLLPFQIILFDGKRNDGLIRRSNYGFVCGFYFPSDQYDSLFFAVGIVENLGDNFTSYVDVVWVANRNKPVGVDAKLQFLPDGNLVLTDADGSLVWSTKTSKRSVAGMKMMETGNLVLHDSNNKTVWQSFDYPTDSLLLGQKLVKGQRLSACASETNMSEGNYYLSVTSQGLFAFYQANAPQMYFRYLAFEGDMEGIELNYSTSGTGSLSLYFFATKPSKPFHFKTVTDYDEITMPVIKFDSYGHLTLYDHGDSFSQVDMLAEYMSACEYPNTCGNLKLCSNGGSECSCPAGYVEDDLLSRGCNEKNPTICENPQFQSPKSYFLVRYKDVYHFSFVDPDAAVLKGTDVESCKEACLNNCSCKVALFQYLHNNSHGNCFLPSPVLSLINGGKKRNNQQSYAFIKVANYSGNGIALGPEVINGERGTRGSPTSATRYKIIVASTVGTFLLVGVIVGCGIMFERKKGDGEEQMEDYLDQLSGMPIRFSYEELKIATGDFQKKIGGGGFGSVFEGCLQEGQKIAVKRLDSLGQGKKEFLAEVKTIGSIHHQNLVTLIGFCVEKLHRLLVYEFMSNGSLDKWIFWRQPQQAPLDWPSRKTIILNIAKGLAYLHEGCRKKIVHLDIKPQNILLDTNLHAKISDFGLSKFIDRDQSRVATTMRGTPGYIAPELITSVTTEKADVYSFGVVLMEVACGRKNMDRSQPVVCMHLLPLLMEKAREDRLIDLIDRRGESMQLHSSEVVKIMRLAIWCLQRDYKKRPSMSMAVKVLEGTMDMEAELDYNMHTPTTIAAKTREAELGTTATEILPSLLSWPR